MKTNLLARILMFVTIAGLFLTSRLNAQQPDIWVSAYYAGWMQGYANNGRLPAEKIDYDALTHIIHFSLVPNSDGSLNSDANSITLTNSQALVSRAHDAGKKVIVSVGGWASDVGFRGATSSSNLSKFVTNLVSFMQSRGYDGIDIDWERLESSDATLYVNFINQLRTALNAISPTPLLTAAVVWQPTILSQVHTKFDQINIMTYDLSGAWPGWVTWHNSPIHNGGATFPSTGNPLPSIDGTVNSFASNGIPSSKIGIGIDFYGYVWSGGNGTPNGGATDPRQSWTTAPTVQANVPYYTIMDSYFQTQYYKWDNAAQVSYLSIDNTGSTGDKFISYDDDVTAKKKIEYARTKGIGGVIIWELGGGFRSNMPVGQQDILVQAVKAALNDGTPTPDTTPPSVAFSAPAAGSTLGGTVTLSANASDNIGVAGVQFKLNGSNIGSEVTTAPYSLSWNTTTIADGATSVTAVARDAAGNQSTATLSVTISNLPTSDVTPPTVSMTAPANSSTVSGTVTVSATASDNVGVTGVQFTLDGQNLGNEITSAPFTTAWNTGSATNGAHTVAAIARDAAGSPTTASVSVTVSNTTTPPSSSDLIAYADALQSPWINNSWSASVTFNSSEQAASGASSIKVVLTAAWGALSLHYGNWGSSYNVDPTLYKSLDFSAYGTTDGVSLSIFLENDLGQSFPKVNKSDISAGQWTSVSIPMSQLNPNNQIIHRVSVQDISGSIKTFYIDNLRFTGNGVAIAAPTLTSPADGSSDVATSPTLGWNSVTDATSYRAQVSTLSSFATTVLDQSNVSGTSVTVSGLSNSTTYYWRVNASNESGTSSWSAVASFFTASVKDTIAPTVAISAPQNGATVSDSVSVTATASDNIRLTGVQFKLNGNNFGTERSSSPYTFSWDTKSVANGSYVISAVARDSAGNQATASVTVTVSNTTVQPANQTVYDENLVSPWINASWNATITFVNSEKVYAGSSAMKVVQNAWGGVRFHSGPWGQPVNVSTANFKTLEFAVFGGSTGLSLGVFFENDLNQSFPSVKYIWIQANQWKVVSLPVSQLNPSNQVVHRIVIQDLSGRQRTFYIDTIVFVAGPATVSAEAAPREAAGSAEAPTSFGLGQNYPNPFNPTTTIAYTLPFDAHVTLEIFNMVGERVSLLVDASQRSGMYSAMFEAKKLASGTYFYRLQAVPIGDTNVKPLTDVRRMVLLK